MKGPREHVEQVILMSVGVAHLTRERAEAVVGELVEKGQLGADEGRQAVDDLMGRVRGESASGVIARIEDGMKGALRELGMTTRGDLDEVGVRLAEIEHRVALLEAAADGEPGPSD